jgi:hypothetical protein
MARRVTAAAALGASMLLLAFTPGRRGRLPSGASRENIQAAFDHWAIVAEEPADASGMPRALQASAPRWYRLKLPQP